jgi:hypothetical protein
LSRHFDVNVSINILIDMDRLDQWWV